MGLRRVCRRFQQTQMFENIQTHDFPGFNDPLKAKSGTGPPVPAHTGWPRSRSRGGLGPPPLIHPILLLLFSPPTLQLPSAPAAAAARHNVIVHLVCVGVFAGIATMHVCMCVCLLFPAHQRCLSSGPVLQPTDSGCWVSQSADPVCCSTWADDFYHMGTSGSHAPLEQ